MRNALEIARKAGRLGSLAYNATLLSRGVPPWSMQSCVPGYSVSPAEEFSRLESEEMDNLERQLIQEALKRARARPKKKERKNTKEKS